MIFFIDEGIFRYFPSLKIGVLVGEIDNVKYGNDHLEKILDDVRTRFFIEKPQDHPNIKIWHEAFRKSGIFTSEYHTFLESLLERALKGGPFTRVNPLLDLCNAISLKHLVPIGIHSLDFINGDITLCFAEGKERFIPMNFGEEETVQKGEVIYKDSKDVLTRRWVWKQSNKDKVLNETTHVFISIDVMEGLPDRLCENVLQDMEESIIQNGYGRIIHKDMLTTGNRRTEFNFS
jgi:DNA/RNA-binding domain of Phe-tRNA-synthetase-like protein